MGQLENWKMTPLDTLLCSNQLQILKSLVFFFPPAKQRQMILLVKLMELKQCLTMPLFSPSLADRSHHQKDNPAIFESIFPYCDREKQQLFQQMQQAFQMINTFRQFSNSGMFDQFAEMMKNSGTDADRNAFPSDSPLNTDTINHIINNSQLTSMFSSMMNPEQQALVSQYEAMLENL